MIDVIVKEIKFKLPSLRVALLPFGVSSVIENMPVADPEVTAGGRTEGRSMKGAANETPREWGMGKRCSPPQPTMGTAERRELPSGIRDVAPA